MFETRIGYFINLSAEILGNRVLFEILLIKYCVFVQSFKYEAGESYIFGVPVEKITTLTYFFHSGLATLVKTKSWSILYTKAGRPLGQPCLRHV